MCNEQKDERDPPYTKIDTPITWKASNVITDVILIAGLTGVSLQFPHQINKHCNSVLTRYHFCVDLMLSEHQHLLFTGEDIILSLTQNIY